MKRKSEWPSPKTSRWNNNSNKNITLILPPVIQLTKMMLAVLVLPKKASWSRRKNCFKNNKKFLSLATRHHNDRQWRQVWCLNWILTGKGVPNRRILIRKIYQQVCIFLECYSNRHSLLIIIQLFVRKGIITLHFCNHQKVVKSTLKKFHSFINLFKGEGKVTSVLETSGSSWFNPWHEVTRWITPPPHEIWDASPSKGYLPPFTQHINRLFWQLVPIYTPGWRGALWKDSVLPKNTTQWPVRCRT